MVLRQTKRDIVRTLKKGESIRGKIELKEPLSQGLMDAYLGITYKPIFKFANFIEMVLGEVESDKIRVTCVPKEEDWVRKYFPDLPELEYK